MKKFLAIFLATVLLLSNPAIAEEDAPAACAAPEEPAGAEGDANMESVVLEEAEEVPVFETGEVPAGEALSPANEAGAEPEDVWLGVAASGAREAGPELEALEITAGKTVLTVGETLSLTVTCVPEGAITPWSLYSSDDTVADVDADGLVTAKGVGNATITALADNGVSADIALRVDPVPPEGIALNYSGTKLLAKGKKLQLEATLSPEGAASKLSWASSRKRIATVNSRGLVTARRVGTATVTVRTANGRRAKVKIRVYNPRAVSRIAAYRGKKAVSSKTIQLVSGAKVTFKAKAYNAAGKRLRYRVTWKSSNTRVATITSSGRLVARNQGTARITAIMRGRKTSFIVKVPRIITRSYKGKKYKIVNTLVSPIAFSKLTRAKRVGTYPYYGGCCLNFCYYYVHCMLSNKTRVSASEGSRGVGSTLVSIMPEKYGGYQSMMGRLYDLLNTGVPQILMVEAVTHPGSRHFVTVVGYRAKVTRRQDLRPRDLLIIDSQDGRLESMDPRIDPYQTRRLFKQRGRYRIEVVKRR